MSDSLVINRSTLRARSLAVAASVLGAVALPQIVHVAGAAAGLGTSLGESLLPMQIPVIAVGLLAGPAAGVVAGVLSPLVSFLLTGMPPMAVLPFLVVELAAYGLAAGALSGARMPAFGKVLATQAAGRVARSLAVLVAVFVLGGHAQMLSQIGSSIVMGVPGILVQWALVPVAARFMRASGGQRD